MNVEAILSVLVFVGALLVFNCILIDMFYWRGRKTGYKEGFKSGKFDGQMDAALRFLAQKSVKQNRRKPSENLDKSSGNFAQNQT